jgi:hypothetical protein
MSKFCPKGHQMEDSWEICPICQTTGYQVSGGGSAGKTRLDSEPPKDISGGAGAGAGAGAPGGSVGGGARRTVLISEKRKPPVVGWFVATSGDQKGEDFRLREGKNSVGSSPDSNIVLRDDTVSGQHASLRCEEGKFFLTDLDSSNGTYVNDKKIAREELKDNDVIRFGELSVKFKCFS